MQDSISKKVYLTGSNGFIGARVKSYLTDKGYEVIAGNRNIDYSDEFKGVTTVVHLAAKVHDFSESSYEAYFKSNVELTAKLVEKAKESGVQKFIFISSIKVNGEESITPYSNTKVCCPSDLYGRSKWEAEERIKELCLNSSLSFTILRPPLVYGPNVKANFKKLISISLRPIPLPFGLFRPKRSFIFVDNLADLILKCIESENAKNQTFLVRDNTNLSTCDLITRIRELNGSKKLIFNFPLGFLKLIFKVIGKKNYYSRLAYGLSIDDLRTRTTLDWKPAFSLNDSLLKTINSYKISEKE